MRPTNYLPSPSLGLSAFTSLILLAAPALAQDKKSSSSASDDKKTSDPPAKQTSKDSSSSSSSDKPPAKETSSSSSSSAPPQKTDTSTSAPSSTSPSSSSKLAGVPTLGGGPKFSDLPTLTAPGAIPTYPPAAVPPTADAPFMRHSTMPSGTVFIAVGTILGAFGLAILLWRTIVSFLLHRSVERAAMAQHGDTTKAGFPAPPAPFYKDTDRNSTLSATGAAPGRGVRRTNRGPTPSGLNPSRSDLFFSPTAAATNPGGARGSSFLPSGFYAAGAGSPAPSHQQSYSMTNLRPDSRGHFASASRSNMNVSPPDSPPFAARRDLSTSSLNLNTAPGLGQRAPSAYLEDLLADDPSSLPPPQMPPAAGSRHPSVQGRTTSPQPRY